MRDAGDGLDAILAGARAGDRDALTSLFTMFHPIVRRYLHARMPEEAEDLASDVWLDVTSTLSSFAGDAAGFRALVFTIARRRLIDARRRRARRTELPLGDKHDVAGGDVEAEALGSLSTAAALAAIGRLPDDQADVVLLRVVGGFSAAEVAGVLGKTPGAVRVIQHRALRRLAASLDRGAVTP